MCRSCAHTDTAWNMRSSLQPPAPLTHVQHQGVSALQHDVTNAAAQLDVAALDRDHRGLERSTEAHLPAQHGATPGTVKAAVQTQ
jgi:hypothetical protein